MRYIGLIVLIDFMVIAVASVLMPGGTNILGGLLAATAICAFGIPLGVVVGIPMLWVARWVAPGSVVPLAFLGAGAGGFCPIIASWGLIQFQMIVLGMALGLISAVLWWLFVERHPERRAYYA